MTEPRPDFEQVRAQFDRICDIEDPSVQSHAAAISYSIVVPALLTAIDELEVRNAKLEAVAVFMKKRGRKVSDCEAVKTTYVDRRPRFRYCGRCPMCKVWAALDALDD